MKITIRNGFEKSNCQIGLPDLQVVIDVFRASSTTLALLKVNVKELIIANDLEIIKDFHSKGYYIISEVFNLGIDNSPTLVLKGNYAEKKTLLKTSNLTMAISENFNSASMIIGAFNNISALVQFIFKKNPDWVEIIPAGLMKIKQANPEDMECAKLLEAKLQGNDYIPNWKKIEERVDQKIQEESRPQFYVDDLQHSLKIDFTSDIPLVKKIDDFSYSVTQALI